MANGEILGVTLLMEDVLQMGYQGATIHPDTRDHSQAVSRSESHSSRPATTTPDLKDAAKALCESYVVLSESFVRVLCCPEPKACVSFILSQSSVRALCCCEPKLCGSLMLL